MYEVEAEHRRAKSVDGELVMYRTYESEHYIFHYRPGSAAGHDLKRIRDCQESCFAKIAEALHVVFPGKIHYWLCDTPEEVGRIYGDNEPCNGFASVPDQVYAVYNDDIHCIGPHEDAHLISYQIHRPDSAFVREGLAMYFDETWWGRPNEDWVKEFHSEAGLPDIRDLFSDEVFHQYSDAVTYPVAGALTRYLITTYGMDAYLQFYRSGGQPWQDSVRECFGTDLHSIIEAFLNSLGRRIPDSREIGQPGVSGERT